MTTSARPGTTARSSGLSDPSYQAFLLLRTAFTVAPVLFGLDKFFGELTDWERYLAPALDDVVPGSAHQAMLIVGVVEVAAGVLVALRPHVGGYVVAAWLAGIILNLLLVPGFYDVALRDFGLLVAALALARMAALFPPGYARRAQQDRRRDRAGRGAGRSRVDAGRRSSPSPPTGEPTETCSDEFRPEGGRPRR